MDVSLIDNNSLEKIENHSEVYIGFLIEQWKTAVEFAKDLSIRRLTMNALFLTGLSLLLSGVLFCDETSNLTYAQYTVLELMICIIGIVLCVLWINQLDYYSSLIAVKYEAIRMIEEYLPAHIYIFENQNFYLRYNNLNNSPIIR